MDFYASINDQPETGVTIGYIIGGGLKENLRARLTIPVQDVQEGSFVVIESGRYQFYGLVTDLALGATDPRFADEQSERRLPPAVAALLHGQTLYANLEILASLMLESGPDPAIDAQAYAAWAQQIKDEPRPLPVKTIPAHHAPVRLARAEDVALIFGDAGKSGNFVIGRTREQDHPVCINLDKFVQRSSGIFGATGSGKSFLTRILLSGLVHYNKASVLVFDMHNEYGPDDNATDTRTRVPGLRGKFPSKVRLVGLGAGSQVRGQSPDFTLEFAERDIQPEDIELLTRELNLKDTTPATLSALVHDFGPARWLHEFRALTPGKLEEDENGKKFPAPDSVEGWAERNGVHPGAAAGLHSKLQRVFRLKYIVEKPAADGLAEIIKALKAGQHIILSFGEHESDLDYLLVANLLTRRIRDEWQRFSDEYRSKGGAEPRPLVIAIEEAHKLLNREMASQTIFATIAREMRKYFVTLLVIDQRPSQIYDDVLSQLGTRISGWLGDDNDIQAVLSGLAAKDSLRGMLARLQPKEEVLLLGWGVPMPLVVRTRRYDQHFWEELLGVGGRAAEEKKLFKDLGF